MPRGVVLTSFLLGGASGAAQREEDEDMVKKLIAGAAATAMAALGVGMATAAPAAAAACPSGALCAYLSANYSGDPGTVYGNNTNLLQYSKFNNAVSVSNSGTQCSVRIYSGTGYTGSSVPIPRGYGIGDLSGTAFYKNVASNYWC